MLTDVFCPLEHSLYILIVSLTCLNTYIVCLLLPPDNVHVNTAANLLACMLVSQGVYRSVSNYCCNRNCCRNRYLRYVTMFCTVYW